MIAAAALRQRPISAIIGHSDMGGRPDGVQVMLHEGHAYVGHMFSDGITVLDVRDPRMPRARGLRRLPAEHPLPPHPGA